MSIKQITSANFLQGNAGKVQDFSFGGFRPGQTNGVLNQQSALERPLSFENSFDKTKEVIETLLGPKVSEEPKQHRAVLVACAEILGARTRCGPKSFNNVDQLSQKVDQVTMAVSNYKSNGSTNDIRAALKNSGVVNDNLIMTDFGINMSNNHHVPVVTKLVVSPVGLTNPETHGIDKYPLIIALDVASKQRLDLPIEDAYIAENKTIERLELQSGVMDILRRLHAEHGDEAYEAYRGLVKDMRLPKVLKSMAD